MYKNSYLVTFYALTPVHPGAGSSLSYVDLPIQRERHTGYPMIAGSGIKGVIRNLAERSWNKDTVNKIFGNEESGDTASLVSFTDAKILFYPVRSVRGVFAWITCPYVLTRLKKELTSFGAEINFNNLDLQNLSDEKIVINNGSSLKIDSNKAGLEEFLFTFSEKDLKDNILNKIKDYLPQEAMLNDFEKRIAIVSNNVFSDLVNYAVEIRTRIKIDQTKETAETGALFTIELVPSEAIFYSFVFEKDDINGKKLDENNNRTIKTLINNSVIQVGGDETTGMGFVKLFVSDL